MPKHAASKKHQKKMSHFNPSSSSNTMLSDAPAPIEIGTVKEARTGIDDRSLPPTGDSHPPPGLQISEGTLLSEPSEADRESNANPPRPLFFDAARKKGGEYCWSSDKGNIEKYSAGSKAASLAMTRSNETHPSADSNENTMNEASMSEAFT